MPHRLGDPMTFSLSPSFSVFFFFFPLFFFGQRFPSCDEDKANGVERAKGNLVHVENSGSMIAWAHATGLRGESCLNVFYREGLEATWVDADSAAAERVLFPFPSIPRFVFPGWETASNNGLSRLHGTQLRYLSTRLSFASFSVLLRDRRCHACFLLNSDSISNPSTHRRPFVVPPKPHTAVTGPPLVSSFFSCCRRHLRAMDGRQRNRSRKRDSSVSGAWQAP
jgi:hypothetical protein